MRKTVLILIGATIILLAGYAGFRSYRVWRQSHMMSLARDFMSKSDARNALLCLQQVLHVNPWNVEATRDMAQFMEAARSPSALLWRSRTVELNPNSTDDRLALVQTAMLFRDYASATNALEGIDANGRKTAGYHNAAGTVAAAGNQIAQAEAHFLEASRLEPANPVPQLNLAVLRLHATNELDQAEARIMLQRIESNPTNSTLRSQAMRELVVDALRSKRPDAALTLARQLVQQTNSVFSDKLLLLGVIHDPQNNEFKSDLAAYRREAVTNNTSIYELTTWQLANLGPTETLTWLRGLPLQIQTNQPAAMFEAECYIMVQDWKGLQDSLKKQNWADLEFVRHAFNTRALKGQALVEAAKSEWEIALSEANGEKSRQVMLFRLAVQWKWQTEAEDLLWTIVNHYPGEKWAVTALGQALYYGGRTRSLMTLYNQEMKRAPSDAAFKNNVALLAILLEANELKPMDLAHEAYETAPTNSSYASTYAYSLLVQKKVPEALKTMEQLRPKELEEPSIAGYYGLILKASGDRKKAKTFLDISMKARLLPEEQKLFSQALATL